MGYQAILDNIRGQTGNSMGDIRDSDTRSSGCDTAQIGGEASADSTQDWRVLWLRKRNG